MLLTITASVLSLAWLGLALRGIRGMNCIPYLEHLSPAENPRDDHTLSSLTVIIAARNEEKAVGGCLESLLAQSYPGSLQIILVDDRSTDATGSIGDEWAAKSGGQLEVIHLTECPPGWLGKCNAMSEGATRAQGDFILFTDGDVRFETTSLSRAVRHMEAEEADMLVVFPDLITHSLGEGALVLVFGQALVTAFPPWKAMQPGSSKFVGVGAFNMVRRSLYERCGGHRFLRLQVVDDAGLGKIMKYAGGRVRVALGRNMIHIRWQDSLAGTIRGLEKNAFAGLGYSVGRTLAAVVLMLFAYLWPWVGMGFGPWQARLLCAVTALVVQPWVGWNATRLARTAPVLAFSLPVGALLFAWTVLRSMIITLRQGGIRWRDSFYSLEELRQHKL